MSHPWFRAHPPADLTPSAGAAQPQGCRGLSAAPGARVAGGGRRARPGGGGLGAPARAQNYYVHQPQGPGYSFFLPEVIFLCVFEFTAARVLLAFTNLWLVYCLCAATAQARFRLDRYSGASECQSAFAVRLRATGFVIETLAGGHGGGGSSLTRGSRGPFSSAQKVRRGFHSACAAQNT